MASAWLYKYILVEHVAQYINDGWERMGPAPPLGGWTSVIVRKEITDGRQKADPE